MVHLTWSVREATGQRQSMPRWPSEAMESPSTRIENMPGWTSKASQSEISSLSCCRRSTDEGRPDNQTNIYFALNGNVADCDDQVHQFFSSDPAFNGTDFGCGCELATATKVKRVLTSDTDVYATMSAPPGPYKYVEDLIFAGSQRYIGSPRGILGLEFKLSQMSV